MRAWARGGTSAITSARGPSLIRSRLPAESAADLRGHTGGRAPERSDISAERSMRVTRGRCYGSMTTPSAKDRESNCPRLDLKKLGTERDAAASDSTNAIHPHDWEQPRCT